MKILKLRFKNINSFYGKTYTIDFTTSPLSETGLFIISGPTGAGKSTLLDVITLALYNEVPRFERISKTEIDKLGSIVNSKAADEPRCEAFAEVEYQVKSGRYRSSWSIAKNRNGNWSNYQMEIARLPEGDLLDVKGLQDYPKKNTDLIGLNYSQFVKSIILAQGSFAEFLKADRHTRTKLLEDITGTHLYRKLGVEAFLRFRDSESKIKLKEEILKGVQLKTKDEIQALNEQRSEQEELRSKAEKELALWETEKTLVLSIAELERARVRIETEKAALTQEAESFNEKRALLIGHESVRHLVAPMTRFEGLTTQTKRAEEGLQARKALGKQLSDSKDELLHKASKLVGVTLSDRELVQEINRFENEILEIEGAIKELRAQAKPMVDELSREIKRESYHWVSQLSVAAFEQNLNVLLAAKEQLRPILNFYEEGFDASERVKALDLDVELLSDLKSLMTDRERLGSEGRNLKSEQEKLSSMIESKQPDLAKNGALLSAQKELIEQKSTQLFQETRRESFEKQREQLREGEPCPLCGSEHHPFLHTYINSLNQISEELELLKKKETQLEKEERVLTVEVEAAKRKQVDIKERLDRMRADYKTVDSSIKAHLLKISLAPDCSRDDVIERLKKVQEEKSTLDRWNKGKEELKLADRLEELMRQLVEIRNEVGRLEEQKRKKYAGDNIKAEVKDWLNSWENVASRSTENLKEVNHLEVEAARLKSEKENLEKELIGDLQTQGMQSIEEAQKRLLPESTYHQLKVREGELRERTKSLADQEKENARQMSEKTALRVFSELPLEALEIKTSEGKSAFLSLVEEVASIQRVLHTEAENRSRFDALVEELERERLEHNKWELLKQYIGDSSGNFFSGFAQSLTLNNLIGLANGRLNKLSDRYILDKPRNDSDGLYVIDTYHGNQARAVSTLSGGETFTVSLALALALSDLASRNVRIESLFIDEGFGTLDAETLESAVTVLERLQMESNKTVGVISHRQEMKERIPVQIQVDKGIEGTSSIRITG